MSEIIETVRNIRHFLEPKFAWDDKYFNSVRVDYDTVTKHSNLGAYADERHAFNWDKSATFVKSAL